ncbi:MAG: Xaa-Pro peptidase family protein [Spirochaetaceae bacterium]|jgi:Xaa-Pro dipeptidase|nr:Xaa-Pro peptidase family protein [Spirochaetaceae bacterium]
MSVFKTRREELYNWMAREGVALVMFEDFEDRRDPAIRWMTGQPGDALLFLSVTRQAMLVPWDINLASRYGNAEVVIPYTGFERRPVKALRAAAEYFKIPLGSRIEIPPVTSYPMFLKYVEGLSDFDVLCREKGAREMVRRLRALKDEEEILIYRKVSTITNEIIDLLEDQIRREKLRTETDIVLFIEAESRKRGCEGTGFETLAAGPERSFGIHAFPSSTAGAFAGRGLSILDFGLKYAGYTTDVTLTFARGPLSKQQQNLVNLVEKGYKQALSLVKEGTLVQEIAAEVGKFFGKSKKNMPHALGHGIGLEAHEAPLIRDREDDRLNPGMVFTLEPGLYDMAQGGCRLENDILLTAAGAEVLTAARIIGL